MNCELLHWPSTSTFNALGAQLYNTSLLYPAVMIVTVTINIFRKITIILISLSKFSIPKQQTLLLLTQTNVIYKTADQSAVQKHKRNTCSTQHT